MSAPCMHQWALVAQTSLTWDPYPHSCCLLVQKPNFSSALGGWSLPKLYHRSAQALSLALSPAVIYCTPWMNPIPSSSPHLMIADCPEDLSLSPAWPCSDAVGLHLLGQISCSWAALRSQLILLCGTACLYHALAIVIMPKALLNEIPLWRVKP